MFTVAQEVRTIISVSRSTNLSFAAELGTHQMRFTARESGRETKSRLTPPPDTETLHHYS